MYNVILTGFHKEVCTMGRHYYDCQACRDKNCKICPASGRNPSMMDTTDTYRQSVKKGYYSSSIISRYDSAGNFIGYGYNKPGE